MLTHIELPFDSLFLIVWLFPCSPPAPGPRYGVPGHPAGYARPGHVFGAGRGRSSGAQLEQRWRPPSTKLLVSLRLVIISIISTKLLLSLFLVIISIISTKLLLSLLLVIISIISTKLLLSLLLVIISITPCN